MMLAPSPHLARSLSLATCRRLAPCPASLAACRFRPIVGGRRHRTTLQVRSITAPAESIAGFDEMAASTQRKYYMLGGKGGVGKTSCAASLAVKFANNGHPTIVVSTDPAHSLSDSFAQDLTGGTLVSVDGVDSPLFALEINPEKAREEFRTVSQNNGGTGVKDFMDSMGLGMLADQLGELKLGELLDTPPPGLDEALAISKVLQFVEAEEYNMFSRIVFDTAPTGHTLRLLSLPDFLDASIGKIMKVIGDNVYTSASTFEDLNLSKELIQGLSVEMRFKSPSKIQAVTLPMILTPPYKDLVAQAHNGSGKTTCFVLGMLSRVDPSKKIPQAICICPTRELAQQNLEVLKKMWKFTGITAVCAIPSDSAHYTPVKKMPPVTDQVVIGTPGTVKRWMSEKKLAMREVKILVFDEADHMLAEDGFKDDSDRIMREIRRSSSRCQVLLFSATFNETVKAFVSKVITEGNQIFVKKEDLSLDKVKQYKVFCPDELAKLEVIKSKIFEFGEKVGQTIIFVRTRNSASMLHKTLKNEGYECTSIHGTLRQEDREQVIREFKDGYTKVLITTDILARGFDQAQVNLVINFDLPVKHNTSEPDYDTYLHRIGRAGRFGRKGAAFNMMSSEDRKIMEKIEDNFKHPIFEVGDWRSEKDFESALKDAGLL